MIPLDAKEMSPNFNLLWDLEPVHLWVPQLLERFSQISGIYLAPQAISCLQLGGTPLYVSELGIVIHGTNSTKGGG